MSKVVGSDGIKDSDRTNPWSGFSIVNADSMEAAISIAKSCPYLEIDGTIEVAEVMNFKKP